LKRACNLFKGFGPNGGWMVCRNRKAAFFICGKEGRMDCKYFGGCSAPLCPKDEGIADRTWFPDEDICRLADVPEWVRRQRKVSRKAARDGYFTAAMLNQDCRICKGLKGLDPDGTDRERADDESAWFKAHPVITAEERERLRNQGKNNGVHFEARHPVRNPQNGSQTIQKTAPEQGLDVSATKKGIQVPLSPG
jgi:hypothetical protein